MNDTRLDELLDGTVLNAWRCMKAVFQNFLGNYMAPDYVQLVHQMLGAFHVMKCNMSHKVTNLVEDFIKTLPQWKNDNRETGRLVCWLTVVGR